MIHWLYRYLFIDLWVPLWPNIVASAVLFAGGYIYHKTVNEPHIQRIKELHEHHLKDKSHGSLGGSRG